MSRVSPRACGSSYKSGCRCDECREWTRLAMRKYVARVKERDGITPTQKARPAKPKTCASCGKAIKGRVVSTYCKPCGDRIRDAHDRARRRLAKASRGTSSNPAWPWVQGVCAYCDTYFVRKNTPSPYCSTACRKKDQPKKHAAVKVTRKQRLAIYERDGWVCQICGDRVDRGADTQSQMAASLDHIEPRSWALIPDDRPSNLRLAHRICNSTRRDLPAVALVA